MDQRIGKRLLRLRLLRKVVAQRSNLALPASVPEGIPGDDSSHSDPEVTTVKRLSNELGKAAARSRLCPPA